MIIVVGQRFSALSYALIEGYITREELLSFYRELFSVKVASPGSVFHDILATCIYDIYPEELLETIEKAYDEELIWPGIKHATLSAVVLKWRRHRKRYERQGLVVEEGHW